VVGQLASPTAGPGSKKQKLIAACCFLSEVVARTELNVARGEQTPAVARFASAAASGLTTSWGCAATPQVAGRNLAQ
jgi:hypothetical protein